MCSRHRSPAVISVTSAIAPQWVPGGGPVGASRESGKEALQFGETDVVRADVGAEESVGLNHFGVESGIELGEAVGVLSGVIGRTRYLASKT
jgi:hypothetical protein